MPSEGDISANKTSGCNSIQLSIFFIGVGPAGLDRASEGRE
ncbi:hypothetical protein EBME_1575 [bacterium endosymbiont of Mortierella elongata FMR23-6]|nr:hypothetical protein EBME_1575 [bacterium endosymbiont of Mortierella elongata FMR23-6]